MWWIRAINLDFIEFNVQDFLEELNSRFHSTKFMVEQEVILPVSPDDKYIDSIVFFNNIT